MDLPQTKILSEITTQFAQNYSHYLQSADVRDTKFNLKLNSQRKQHTSFNFYERFIADCA